MPAESLSPALRSRRSFVYRELERRGARFTELAGAAVAHDFGADVEREADAARALALADLSPLPRSGFKGAGALAWLGQQGVRGLAADNMADLQDDGGLALRLAPTETLLLGDLHGRDSLLARLERAWSFEAAPGCYPAPRRESHFWFALAGAAAAAMFAKLCGVDLRPGSFANHRIAQTSIARMSSIVVRRDLGATLGYFLLGDSASAEFMWGALIDAMAEFDGRPVGIAALHRLAGA
ncbi:MAG: sarcosine oxidase [Alphaproteobacteria bacterium]